MSYKTALQLYADPTPRTFTTGCTGLDSFLGGGMPLPGLTEICGESGAGKTQLCLQLLLTAQRSIKQHGLNGKTLFLSCEGPFPIRRLQEMAKYVAKTEFKCSSSNVPTEIFDEKSPDPPSQNAIEKRSQELVDNILISKINDAEQLMDVMTVTLPMELRRGQVKLVIVDSITAICRGHYEHTISGLSERADVLISLASYMKQMSDRYSCAFVVVNQVSACFQLGQKSCSSMASSFIHNGQEPPPERPKPRKKRKGNNSEEIEHSQVVPLPKCTPALGITWTSCINTRIMLTRGNENEDVDGFLRRREMRLLLSSKYTCGTLCHYHVTRSGVNRVSDEMLQWNG
jgi:RecA/RadA recombinase